MAVLCSESIECFLGIYSKFFLKLLATIPVAPIITGIIVNFKFHIRCNSKPKLLHFNFFSASFCTTFLSAGIATSISIIIIIIIIIILRRVHYDVLLIVTSNIFHYVVNCRYLEIFTPVRITKTHSSYCSLYYKQILIMAVSHTAGRFLLFALSLLATP